jgi:hypothetical protein
LTLPSVLVGNDFVH